MTYDLYLYANKHKARRGEAPQAQLKVTRIETRTRNSTIPCLLLMSYKKPSTQPLLSGAGEEWRVKWEWDNSARASPLFHHYRGQIGSGEIVVERQNYLNTTISPSSISGEIVVDLPLNSGDHDYHYLVVSRGNWIRH